MGNDTETNLLRITQAFHLCGPLSLLSNGYWGLLPRG